MSTHNILTADEQYLKQLDCKTSVELFQNLLWAEAHKMGIPISKVTISMRINVPDGGVDAEINADDIALPLCGLIEKGKNIYQIKAGDSFKPQNKSIIKKELFGKKNPSFDTLPSEVRSCLEKKGRYVVVCFGIDLTPVERKKAKKNLLEYLRICGFNSPNVDVWSVNNIKAFLEQYPALSLQTNKFYNEPFLTQNEWEKKGDMLVPFIAGREQDEMLDGIRNQLRRNDSPSQLRILGEAGLGKTRLALEVTSIDDLRPLVVYVLASDFDQSPVMTELIRNGDLNAIIIVDECDSDQRARFWNNLKSYYPRIKLVSINNESDTVTNDTMIYELSALDDEQVSKIIQGYGISKFEADRWVIECGGSPRVAHVVGENLRSNPEDILKQPSNINIWDRYITGKYKYDSENARQRRTVLQHIALFKRFGYESPVKDEALLVHKLIQEADPLITLARFREIIEEIKKQHILQGKSTLYITPKLLHIKLWLDWWDLHGDDFDVNRITEFPTRLIEWFFEMFEYAVGSPSASQKAKELLDEKGIFDENRGEVLKGGIGARFFFHLTLAEPISALKCLQRTVGTWSKEELLCLSQTRLFIISSLEHIAIWKDLFQGAARLLLLLGEAENQTYSNNASGVFAKLFQLSEHKVLSKSEATPRQRVVILQEALYSKSPEARRLGLEACKKALSWEIGGIVRNDHRVVGKQPDLWHPKTYGDLFEAYREIWKLLLIRYDSLDGEERKIAYKNILESASNLGEIHLLNEMILDDLEVISEKYLSEVEKELLIAMVLNFIHYHKREIPSEVKDRWDKLQKKLTGGNYHELLVRHIAMNLIIDRFDESNGIIDKIENKIKELANYGINHYLELKKELQWLMINDFNGGRGFAAELGKIDNEQLLIRDIIRIAKEQKDKKTPSIFLGSYLQTLFARDNNEWMKLVQTFADDDDLVYVVPMVIWYTHELTDDLAGLLINLAKAGKIGLVEFRLFEYVDFFKAVSQSIIEEWFDLLLSQNDVVLTLIALSTHHYLYIYKKQSKIIPEELTLRLLTNPSFFTPSNKISYDQMGEYNWAGVAGSFIEQFPDHSLEISKVVLEHIADENTFFGRNFSEIINIVGKVALLFPEQVWKQIARYLDPPYNNRSFAITSWLHGRSEILGNESMTGHLDLFPPNAIWDWVNGEVEQRAWFLATFVPKALHHEENKICWARELLVLYGNFESVKNNLHANLSSGSWSGSASLYFTQRQKDAIDFRNEETDPQVITWLDEYICSLKNDILRERIREERDE